MKFLELQDQQDSYKFWAYKVADGLWLHYRGQTWKWKPKSKHPKPKQKKLDGLLKSAMPGRIDKISIKKDDKIKKGQTLLIMSAMKMEYSFKAEAEGYVEKVYCKEGQTVDSDQNLIKVCYLSKKNLIK